MDFDKKASRNWKLVALEIMDEQDPARILELSDELNRALKENESGARPQPFGLRPTSGGDTPLKPGPER